MCGALPAQTVIDPALLAAQTVVRGVVTRAGQPVTVGYARLHDGSGEFVAEVPLNAQGEFGLGEQLPSILNNSGFPVTGIANTTGNGNLGIQTSGVVANAAYTLIVTLRKNNAMYQRGQLNDPAAFNAGIYSLKP